MPRHKDIQPDPLSHIFCRPKPYRMGQAWHYTAQMENDNGVTADLTVWDNDGKKLFSGRVHRSIASTALSVLSEEERAKGLDTPQRQVIMDMARSARSVLENRLGIQLD